MRIKKLNAQGKGELDYDYANDILFFKVKDRNYDHSLELEDLVLDIDDEGFITGVQMFDASKTFNIDKDALMNIRNWEFKLKAEDKVIYLQLNFNILVRNQVIERGQNLIRESASLLTNSEVLCKMEA